MTGKPGAAPSDTKGGERKPFSLDSQGDLVERFGAAVAHWRFKPSDGERWFALARLADELRAALPRYDGAPDRGFGTYDYVRLVEWMKDPRESANTAFTTGPLRAAARAFEDAIPAYTARILKIYEDSAPPGNNVGLLDEALARIRVWEGEARKHHQCCLSETAFTELGSLIERARAPEEPEQEGG